MEIAAPVAIAQNCLAGCGQGQSGGEIPRQTRSEQIKLLSAKAFALRVEFSAERQARYYPLADDGADKRQITPSSSLEKEYPPPP